MKRIIRHLVITTLCICSLSITTLAAPTTTIVPTAIPEKATASDPLIARLNEIKDMDKSALSSSEKRALRKEVKALKNSINNGGGVYLSVGAIIIIVLLLILLV